MFNNNITVRTLGDSVKVIGRLQYTNFHVLERVFELGRQIHQRATKRVDSIS